jgi:hypothetical protein
MVPAVVADQKRVSMRMTDSLDCLVSRAAAAAWWPPLPGRARQRDHHDAPTRSPSPHRGCAGSTAAAGSAGTWGERTRLRPFGGQPVGRGVPTGRADCGSRAVTPGAPAGIRGRTALSPPGWCRPGGAPGPRHGDRTAPRNRVGAPLDRPSPPAYRSCRGGLGRVTAGGIGTRFASGLTRTRGPYPSRAGGSRGVGDLPHRSNSGGWRSWPRAAVCLLGMRRSRPQADGGRCP